MKNKQLLFTFFGLMVVTQLAIPISLIFQNNKVLKNGTEFCFRLQPIDPIDPFRGEFIILNFTDNTFNKNLSEGEERDLKYVLIENNEDGFAHITGFSSEKPSNTNNYLELPIDYSTETEYIFNFPFDRFYMAENKAQKAEDLYFETLNDSSSINYAVVKINNGKSSLLDVQVNGVSLVDLVGEE